MPFLGNDWRAPGNVWVKNTGGWERIVALRENLNRHIKKLAHDRLLVKNWQLASEVDHSIKEWDASQNGDLTSTPFWKSTKRPTFRKLSQYVFLPKGAGRERSQYITVGEILLKLDFCSALHQLSRFQYVCRFLELVIQNHYSSLSGSALKCLFGIVEEAVNVAMETKYNVNQVRSIIKTLIKALQLHTKSYIGGKAGWNCHYHIAHVWLNQLNNIQYEERQDDGKPALTDLPEECLTQILKKMQDHCDITHTGEANKLLHGLSSEWKLWRDFCRFHFSKEHLAPAIPKNKLDYEIDWKKIYKKLRTKHGVHEVFADQLQLCCHCYCLFWMGGTHPCSIDVPLERGQRAPEHQVARSRGISPKQLSDMFPLPR
ncbi:F-box only protein 32 isoform X1 [Strongylocentrotus purpuratus]|uniref:F-box domain-containing protein n=1 Tax=Strongylocentrotus purpuratus TaxID=7668 RepID=A0A7M7NT79_STRPU|nr:F-box only protein 32 isoform X1 [Strongylocentrotus purpuratus]